MQKSAADPRILKRQLSKGRMSTAGLAPKTLSEYKTNVFCHGSLKPVYLNRVIKKIEIPKNHILLIGFNVALIIERRSFVKYRYS